MRLVLLALACVLASATVACSGGDKPTTSDNSNVDSANDSVETDDAGPSSSGSDLCDTDRVGCPCYNEGASFDCGRVHRHQGNYESCVEGRSTCHDGVWGACEGDRVVGQK